MSTLEPLLRLLKWNLEVVPGEVQAPEDEMAQSDSAEIGCGKFTGGN